MGRGPAAREEAIELLHFGYHAAIAESRRLLAAEGLSRVHHRILYVLRRRPGLTVGELTELNQVSRQAAHRPLQQLIGRGLVAVEVREADRRSRTLALSDEGRRLEAALTRSILRAFEDASAQAGPKAAEGWRALMRALVDCERARGLDGVPGMGAGWLD
ncbi:MAG: MarR family transcriptional regulator [Myxococcales bacterium]|nr:MarR family transcriptional regulator [Myxococcales bacterium]